MKALSLALFVPSLLAIGCGSGQTIYTPRVVAQSELTLRYDDGFEMWSAGKEVAHGTHYDGLEDFVGCVPAARQHAREASKSGSDATLYTALAFGFGTATFGGLGGLAFQDKPAAMGAFFGGGIALGALGVVFGALSRTARNDANGHAIDAMNYYNDAVGSVGNSCVKRSPGAAPAAPPATPPSAAPATPPPLAPKADPPPSFPPAASPPANVAPAPAPPPPPAAPIPSTPPGSSPKP